MVTHNPMNNRLTVLEEKTTVRAVCSPWTFDILIECVRGTEGCTVCFTDYDDSLVATGRFANISDIAENAAQLMPMVEASYMEKHGKHREPPVFSLHDGQVVMELFGCTYNSIADFPARELLDLQYDEYPDNLRGASAHEDFGHP